MGAENPIQKIYVEPNLHLPVHTEWYLPDQSPPSPATVSELIDCAYWIPSQTQRLLRMATESMNLPEKTGENTTHHTMNLVLTYFLDPFVTIPELIKREHLSETKDELWSRLRMTLQRLNRNVLNGVDEHSSDRELTLRKDALKVKAVRWYNGGEEAATKSKIGRYKEILWEQFSIHYGFPHEQQIPLIWKTMEGTKISLQQFHIERALWLKEETRILLQQVMDKSSAIDYKPHEMSQKEWSWRLTMMFSYFLDPAMNLDKLMEVESRSFVTLQSALFSTFKWNYLQTHTYEGSLTDQRITQLLVKNPQVIGSWQIIHSLPEELEQVDNDLKSVMVRLGIDSHEKYELHSQIWRQWGFSILPNPFRNSNNQQKK